MNDDYLELLRSAVVDVLSVGLSSDVGDDSACQDRMTAVIVYGGGGRTTTTISRPRGSRCDVRYG